MGTVLLPARLFYQPPTSTMSNIEAGEQLIMFVEHIFFDENTTPRSLLENHLGSYLILFFAFFCIVVPCFHYIVNSNIKNVKAEHEKETMEKGLFVELGGGSDNNNKFDDEDYETVVMLG